MLSCHWITDSEWEQSGYGAIGFIKNDGGLDWMDAKCVEELFGLQGFIGI